MCGLIPTPPGDVDMTLPASDEGFPTLRDRVAFHLQNPACAGCHVLMDPIGLGLERFDALGQYRLTENGVPIDPSSEIDGVAFEDAAGLDEIIADSEDTRACLVRTMYRYATGHVERLGETQTLSRKRSVAAWRFRTTPHRSQWQACPATSSARRGRAGFRPTPSCRCSVGSVAPSERWSCASSRSGPRTTCA
jgi:hypothetical protein